MFIPEQSLPENLSCIIAVYDIRVPEAVEALHHARAAWKNRSDIEALDKVHCVLILRPGGALETA